MSYSGQGGPGGRQGWRGGGRGPRSGGRQGGGRYPQRNEARHFSAVQVDSKPYDFSFLPSAANRASCLPEIERVAAALQSPDPADHACIKLPSILSELCLAAFVKKMREWFKQSVHSRFGIYPPKDTLNRWLFDMLSSKTTSEASDVSLLKYPASLRENPEVILRELRLAIPYRLRAQYDRPERLQADARNFEHSARVFLSAERSRLQALRRAEESGGGASAGVEEKERGGATGGDKAEAAAGAAAPTAVAAVADAATPVAAGEAAAPAAPTASVTTATPASVPAVVAAPGGNPAIPPPGEQSCAEQPPASSSAAASAAASGANSAEPTAPPRSPAAVAFERLEALRAATLSFSASGTHPSVLEQRLRALSAQFTSYVRAYIEPRLVELCSDLAEFAEQYSPIRLDQLQGRPPLRAEADPCGEDGSAIRVYLPGGVGGLEQSLRGELGERGFEFEISRSHYDKLCALYEANAGRHFDSARHYMKTMIFILLRRYQTFFGTERFEGTSFHAAAPERVFRTLHARLQVAQECFASPLNCFFSQFCSAFPEIDVFFGSRGSFFDFDAAEGSFECGPPYTEECMDRTARRVLRMCGGEGSAGQQPLLFVIFVPEWRVPPAQYHGDLESSPLCRFHFTAPAGRHFYVSGDQHSTRCGSSVGAAMATQRVVSGAELSARLEGRFYVVPHGTHVYFVCNDRGFQKYCNGDQAYLEGAADEILRGLMNPMNFPGIQVPRARDCVTGAPSPAMAYLSAREGPQEGPRPGDQPGGQPGCQQMVPATASSAAGAETANAPPAAATVPGESRAPSTSVAPVTPVTAAAPATKAAAAPPPAAQADADDDSALPRMR